MVASLAVLSLFVIAMIMFRMVYTRSPEHIAIAWNLLLAWIPLALALIVYDRARTGVSTPALAAVGLALAAVPSERPLPRDRPEVRRPR